MELLFYLFVCFMYTVSVHRAVLEIALGLFPGCSPESSHSGPDSLYTTLGTRGPGSWWPDPPSQLIDLSSTTGTFLSLVLSSSLR